MDSATLTTRSQNLLAAIREAIEKGNKQPRWPKGHPNGGQWKPTGAGGIGGGQGSMFDNPYLKNKMKEAESALGEAKGLLGAGVATAGAVAGATAGAGLAGTAGAVIGGKVGQAIGEKAAEGLGLTATHAQPGPGGKPITIKNPSTASAPETWRDSKAAATWTPKSEVPDHINGTPVKPWKAPKTDAEWDAVEGQMTLPEPPLPQALDTLGKPKRPGAGVVITEPDGRVWIVKPTNEFGGYKHSYPKGGKESGIPSLQANAIKEAWEESGLKVEINGILGDYEGDTSIARYYTASRTGGSPADMGWETQATLLVPASELKTYLNRSRDREIADDLVARLGRTVGKSDIAKRIYALMEAIELEKGDPNQPRWPKGHPRGGQWKPTGAGGVGGAGATGGAAGLPKEPFKPSFATGANPNNGALKAANKAIQKYADMANAGDVTGLLAAKPTDPGTVKGPNNYIKKKWSEWHNAHDYATSVQSTGAGPTSTPATRRESGPMKLSGLTQTGPKKGGSNPGGVFTDKNGNTWIVKGALKANDAQHAANMANNEVLAARLYNAAGALAPEMRAVAIDTPQGKKLLAGQNKVEPDLAVASKSIDGLQDFKPANAAHINAAQQDFALDAWLANWDAIGLSSDNVMLDEKGQAVRIDPGGSLLFRAQGEPKGAKFGKSAGEWDTLRDPNLNPQSAAVFAKMTDSQLKASAAKLQNISDETIQKLVDKHGPGDAKAKAEMTDILIARKQDVLKRAGIADDAAPKTDNADLMALFLGTENGGKDVPAPGATAPSNMALPPFGPKNPMIQQDIEQIGAKLANGDVDGLSDYLSNTTFGDKLQAAALVALGAGDKQLQSVDGTASDIWASPVNAGPKQIIESNLGDPATWAEKFGTAKPTPKPSVTANASIPKPKVFGDKKIADADAIHAALQAGDADAIASYKAKTVFGDTYQAAALVALGAGDKRINLADMGIKFTAGEVWSNSSGKHVDALVEQLGKPETWIKTPAQASQDAAAAVATPALPNKLPSTSKSLLPQPTKYGLSLSDPIGTAMLDLASSGEYGTLKNVDLGTLPESMKQYKQALLSTLEGKWGNQYGSGTGAGTASVTQTATTALGAQARAKSAVKADLPDFNSYLLPASNTNAGAHNKQIHAVKQAAQEGDVNSILAMSFGSNTYAKKQVKVANDALAALGSEHKVTTSQKKGTHPGLSTTAAGKKTAQTVQAQAEAAKPKPTINTATLPKPHNFSDFNGDGKGLSSKAWKNQANQDVESKIRELALKGDLKALESATYDLLDPDTGAKTGKTAMISEHPSKYVQQYHIDTAAWLRDQLYPPKPLPKVRSTHITDVADIASKFPSKPFGTVTGKVKSNEKFGFWIALGQVDNVDKITPKKTQNVGGRYVEAAYADYKKMSSEAKTFVSHMQGSGAFADAYRNGESSYSGSDLKTLTKHALQYSKALPAGTTVYRWQNMPESMIKKIETAENGTIVQANGPMPTSMGPTSTKHFGTHRVKIYYSEGARAVMSFGSGSFAGEKEITTLPNSRFVLLSKGWVPDTEHGNKTKKRLEIELLMLPPDVGLPE